MKDRSKHNEAWRPTTSLVQKKTQEETFKEESKLGKLL